MKTELKRRSADLHLLQMKGLLVAESSYSPEPLEQVQNLDVKVAVYPQYPGVC